MIDSQLSEFKEWFLNEYSYSAEYFELAHFDVERGFFTANDMYDPSSTDAAWVLRASFSAWQHQQAVIDELIAANTDLDRQRNQYRDNAATYKKRNDLARSLIASHEKHHLSPPEVTLKAVDRALQAYGEPLNHEYASLRT